MNVTLSGSTGLIGRALIDTFSEKGWNIHPVPRDSFKLSDEEFLAHHIEGADVVISLTGATILKRWTNSYKKVIYESRVETTKKIVSAIKMAKVKPRLFISNSAIGIYDPVSVHDEESTSFADDFLGRLCRDWEAAAFSAKDLSRVVVLRTGIVLSRKGGAMKTMYTPFSLGLGGVIGTGDQFFSFIHIRDLMHVFSFVVEHENISGVVNAVAPNPTTNYHLTKIFGKVLVQGTFLKIPAVVLKARYGEAASTLITGQQVIPAKLLASGFAFEFPTIEKSLLDLYRV